MEGAISSTSWKSMQPCGHRYRLLEVMLQGETLSTMEIIREFRMVRPGSTIHYLRAKLNVPIETIWEIKIKSNGKVIRYARYRIPPSLLQEQRERFGL